MLSKAIQPFVVVIILVLCIASAVAASRGNESKGRKQFRQTCKNCHTKGATGGEISPLSKTTAQWQKYFSTGTHARGQEPIEKVMNAEQLRDVEAFLTAHAADSLQPETCGR
ncbi:MAG: cytochrome c [Acidobacteriia bacterium]|nr:cytochrome c [Terriglobia bacterium]